MGWRRTGATFVVQKGGRAKLMGCAVGVPLEAVNAVVLRIVDGHAHRLPLPYKTRPVAEGHEVQKSSDGWHSHVSRLR